MPSYNDTIGAENRRQILHNMPKDVLLVIASRSFDYGYANLPAIKGRWKMTKAQLADALHERSEAARADVENFTIWANWPENHNGEV